MKNKILIKLILPEINEMKWKIKKMIIKCVNDINNINLEENREYTLIKKENSRIYKNNEIIADTDIRNASELILISN